MSDPPSPSAKPRGLARDHRRSSVNSVVSRGRRRGLPSLTPRERDVLTRLAQGKTNRQIAIALKASPRTIEKHVEHILAKLGATNRTVAALLAARASNP